jgi:hypothetical protein
MEGMKMLKSFKRLASAFLIAVFIMGSLYITNAEAASLSAPKNLRFSSWTTEYAKVGGKKVKACSFKKCKVVWKAVSGANAYEVRCTKTDGSGKIKAVLYGKHEGAKISGLRPNYVYKCQVRALKVSKSKKVKYSSKWSNTIYITPWPQDVTAGLSGGKNVKINWNKIHSSSGYSVYLSTSPSTKWYLNVNTAHKSSATTATIKNYRGSALKKYQNYYVRIVTLHKHDGKYRTLPTPFTGYWSYRFYLYNKN